MALNPRKEKCFNDYSKLEVGEGVPAKKGTVLILMTNHRTQSLHDRWKFPGEMWERREDLVKSGFGRHEAVEMVQDGEESAVQGKVEGETKGETEVAKERRKWYC